MDSRNPSDRGGARIPPLGPTQELKRLAFPPETSYAHQGPPRPQLDLAYCKGAIPAGTSRVWDKPHKWDGGAVFVRHRLFPWAPAVGFRLGGASLQAKTQR